MLQCKAYRRVRDSVNKDWLPTPVRALVQILLRYEDHDIRDALESLEDNVGSFKERKEVWEDIELQAVAGVRYAGKAETDEQLSLARHILCKVSLQYRSLRLTQPADMPTDPNQRI